ncbi:unnamed protein product [Spirodela intermedia]|uniref:Uncharacterized protein n=1 Tax=Spirodela intermedia TaxID=51605 RepID=A0A7I8KPP3_SPIIN|nr:unnamed protein product [Spirodela intermedia]
MRKSVFFNWANTLIGPSVLEIQLLSLDSLISKYLILQHSQYFMSIFFIDHLIPSLNPANLRNKKSFTLNLGPKGTGYYMGEWDDKD